MAEGVIEAGSDPMGRALQAQRATWVSVGVNLVMTLAQLFVGWMAHSQSLIAHGLHSFSDLLSDFLVIWASRQSVHPADQAHPYGHVAGSVAPVLLERTQGVPGLYWKTVLLFLGSGLLAVLYFRNRDKRLHVMVVALLLMRVGFNWFVLPDRNAEDWGNLCRQSTIEAGLQFRDRPMYLLGDTELQMTNAFYLTNARQQIVPRVAVPTDFNAVYIIHPEAVLPWPREKVGEFKYRHGKGVLDLVVFGK